jgi:hypothetical protein
MHTPHYCSDLHACFCDAVLRQGFRLVLDAPFEGEMVKIGCIAVVIFRGHAVHGRRADLRSRGASATPGGGHEVSAEGRDGPAGGGATAGGAQEHEQEQRLREVSLPEAQALPHITENLNQMNVCINKLFGA